MICWQPRVITNSRSIRGRPPRDLNLNRSIVWCKTLCFCFADIHCLSEPALGVLKRGDQIIRVLLGRIFATGIVDYGFDRSDHEMNSVFCARKKRTGVAGKGRQIVNFAPIDYIAFSQDLDDLHQRIIRQRRIRFRVDFDLFDRFENVAPSSAEAKCRPDSSQFRSVHFVSQFLLILSNGNCECNDDCSACTNGNNAIHHDAGSVHVHPFGCTRPFEQASHEMCRQTTNSKRQQCYSAVFDHCSQSKSVLHHSPVFDFRAIVARPHAVIPGQLRGQKPMREVC